MPKIQYTERAETLLQQTVENCKSYRHEFVTPEHMLECILKHTDLPALIELFASPTQLKKKVKEHLRTFDKMPENREYQPELSAQMAQLIERACQKVFYSSAEQVDIPHLIHAMLELEDSWAAYLLKEAIGDNEEIFMSDIILWYENELQDEGDDVLDESVEEEGESQAAWKKLVTCMNDLVDSHNPLIGRESELERTIQVLCRREKNNPLHVGEPGVGKTALVYGLVRRIVDGQVPNRLKDSRVYQRGLVNLAAVNNQVDLIITHCCSNDTCRLIGVDDRDRMTDYLQKIRDTVQYDYWFFGHHHLNRTVAPREICIYKQVLHVYDIRE